MYYFFRYVKTHWRMELRILGIAGVLLSVYLLTGAVVSFSSNSTVKDDDGYSKTWTLDIVRDGAVIVFPVDGPWMQEDMYGLKLEVESVGNGKQVFIGTADRYSIDAWTSGITYDEVTDLRIYPERISFEEHEGDIADSVSTSNIDWISTNTGSKNLVLNWNPHGETMVIMNADHSAGIQINVAIWTQVGYQFIAGSLNMMVGVFLLLVSLFIVFVSRRSRNSAYPMPLDLPKD